MPKSTEAVGLGGRGVSVGRLWVSGGMLDLGGWGLWGGRPLAFLLMSSLDGSGRGVSVRGVDASVPFPSPGETSFLLYALGRPATG